MNNNNQLTPPPAIILPVAEPPIEHAPVQPLSAVAKYHKNRVSTYSSSVFFTLMLSAFAGAMCLIFGSTGVFLPLMLYLFIDKCPPNEEDLADYKHLVYLNCNNTSATSITPTVTTSLTNATVSNQYLPGECRKACAKDINNLNDTVDVKDDTSLLAVIIVFAAVSTTACIISLASCSLVPWFRHKRREHLNKFETEQHIQQQSRRLIEDDMPAIVDIPNAVVEAPIVVHSQRHCDGTLRIYQRDIQESDISQEMSTVVPIRHAEQAQRVLDESKITPGGPYVTATP